MQGMRPATSSQTILIGLPSPTCFNNAVRALGVDVCWCTPRHQKHQRGCLWVVRMGAFGMRAAGLQHGGSKNAMPKFSSFGVGLVCACLHARSTGPEVPAGMDVDA